MPVGPIGLLPESNGLDGSSGGGSSDFGGSLGFQLDSNGDASCDAAATAGESSSTVTRPFSPVGPPQQAGFEPAPFTPPFEPAPFTPQRGLAAESYGGLSAGAGGDAGTTESGR